MSNTNENRLKFLLDSETHVMNVLCMKMKPENSYQTG